MASALSLCIACSDDSSSNSETENVVLEVISVEPYNGALQVPIGQTVTVTLNHKIDTSSVDDTCLTLSPQVAGAISATDSTLIFTPSSDLDSNTYYQATLSTRLRCVGNDNLDEAFNWSFKTVDGAGYYWYESPDSAARWMTDVIWAQGKFVMVGYTDDDPVEGRVFTSPDGVVWAEHEVDALAMLLAVTYFRNQFIAVGQAGRVYSSPTGEVWTRVDARIGSAMSDIASNDSLAVATSVGKVYTTGDGNSWTEVPVPPLDESILSICWTGSIFVATSGCDTATCILTSADGVTWVRIRIENDSPTNLIGVGCSEDLIVAVGPNENIFTSADGAVWQKQDFGSESYDFDDAWLRDVIWDGNRFVVVGEHRWMEGGVSAISLDGVTWVQHSFVPGFPGYFRAIAWSGEKLVVASNDMEGRIFYSPE